MYDSIIFDIDGTLWDSCNEVAESWNYAIEQQLGVKGTLTGAGLKPWFGKPIAEIAAGLFPELEAEQLRSLEDALDVFEIEHLQTHPGTLYPQTKETLLALHERYPLYIVSNCQKGYIECLIHGGKLEGLFSGWLCWADTGLSKDGTLRTLMAQYGLKHPVYVGDTQGDFDACKKAGIPMIYAAYGLGNVEDPEQQIGTIRQLDDLL